MDNITKITLLTLFVAILTLIVSMVAMPSTRIRFVIQFVFSSVTCYWILKSLAHFRNQELYIWGIEDYNTYKLVSFCRSMLPSCIIYISFSWLFFYLLLRIVIVKIFHVPLREWILHGIEKSYNSEDKSLYYLLIKGIAKGIGFRKDINPFNPKDSITPPGISIEDQVDYEYYQTFSNLCRWIHGLCCIIILDLPYKLALIIAMLFILLIMIFIFPFMQAMLNHLKNTATNS